MYLVYVTTRNEMTTKEAFLKIFEILEIETPQKLKE